MIEINLYEVGKRQVDRKAVTRGNPISVIIRCLFILSIVRLSVTNVPYKS